MGVLGDEALDFMRRPGPRPHGEPHSERVVEVSCRNNKKRLAVLFLRTKARWMGRPEVRTQHYLDVSQPCQDGGCVGCVGGFAHREIESTDMVTAWREIYN